MYQKGHHQKLTHATAGDAVTAVMPTTAEIPETTVTTAKSRVSNIWERQNIKVVSNSTSNRRKTINSEEKNNSRTSGTPTSAKALQQQG
jgi:hypothetical protein